MYDVSNPAGIKTIGRDDHRLFVCSFNMLPLLYAVIASWHFAPAVNALQNGVGRLPGKFNLFL